MSRTLSYTRVSHRDSLTGFSLDAQDALLEPYRKLKKLPEWADVPGTRGPGRFEDRAVSAWKFDLHERPQGRILIAELRPGDHLIFPSMDRAFRSVENWARQNRLWDGMDITLHFIRQGIDTKSAAGLLIANVLSAFAQFKSDMLSERLRMQRLDKMARPAERAIIPQHTPLTGRDVVARRLWELRHGKTPAPVNRVYGYVRCSHIEQVESGRSLAMQNDTVRNCAQRLEGWGRDPTRIFVDEAISAWRMPFASRPMGSVLCSTLVRGDHVIVSRLDRAFRSVQDMAMQLREWDAAGIVIHFADSGLRSDDREGRLLLGTLCLMAEYESELMSEAIAEGIARRGHAHFYVPPWITKSTDGLTQTLEINYEQLAIAYEAIRLYHSGMSIDAVADELERRRACEVGCLPIPREGVSWEDAKKYGVTWKQQFKLKGNRVRQPWNRGAVRQIVSHEDIFHAQVALLEGWGDPEEFARLKYERGHKSLRKLPKRDPRRAKGIIRTGEPKDVEAATRREQTPEVEVAQSPPDLESPCGGPRRRLPCPGIPDDD